VLRHFANLPNGAGMPVALKAADAALKYQNAALEQSKLQAEVNESGARTNNFKIKAAEAQLDDRYVPVKIGKDSLNFPTYTVVGDEIPMWKSDGTYDQNFADSYKNAITDAKGKLDPVADKDAQVQMMKVSDLNSNKNALAGVTMQAKVQIAQDRNAAMLEASQTRAAATLAKSGQTQDRMSMRILSSAELGSAALSNIANMNFGADRGLLGTGVGAKPGANLFEMTSGALRNKLSDQDTQLYNVAAAGLERNLAMLEMQGGLQGGQHFSEQIGAALKLAPGDTHVTVMAKLAEARQIIDTATKVYMSNPNVAPEIRAEVQGSLDRLHQAVPFTVRDVQNFDKQTQGRNNMTFLQYAQKNNLGEASVPAGTPPANAAAIKRNPAQTEPTADKPASAKAMPSGDKLAAYAKKFFGGDEEAAKQSLAKQGYQ
jgi:hypothetical protein